MKDTTEKIDITCDHDEHYSETAHKWNCGLKVYISAMSDSDKILFNDKLVQVGFDEINVNCWACIDLFCKKVGAQAKIGGVRFSDIFTFFLDLYSLSGWHTYKDSEVGHEALTFTKNKESPMFPEFTDDELYDFVQKQLDALFPVQNLTTKTTLKQWLETRMWANHGTASDVDKALFVDKELVVDKATLAYEMGDELTLPLDTSWINKVFPKRDRKNRIIIVGPANEYILGSYVNKQVMHLLHSDKHIISNSAQEVDVRKVITEQLLSGNYALPIDQSAFDQNQRKAAVLAARDWCVKRVFEQTREQELLQLMSHVPELISAPGWEQHLQWESGLLSGKWYTSAVGSLLNIVEVTQMMKGVEHTVLLPTLHQGDDASLVVKDIEAVATIMQQAQQLGIDVNPSKNFVDIYRTDYLHEMYLVGPALLELGSTFWTLDACLKSAIFTNGGGHSANIGVSILDTFMLGFAFGAGSDSRMASLLRDHMIVVSWLALAKNCLTSPAVSNIACASVTLLGVALFCLCIK